MPTSGPSPLVVTWSVALQLAVIYTPLAGYFGTVPLTLADWGLIGATLAAVLPLYRPVAVVVRRSNRDPVST